MLEIKGTGEVGGTSLNRNRPMKKIQVDGDNHGQPATGKLPRNSAAGEETGK